MNAADPAAPLELPDIPLSLPEAAPAQEAGAPDLTLPDLGKVAHEANQAREKDSVALSQLIWRSPVGSVFPLKLTVSKWTLFQALASLVASTAVNRSYMDAGIILFLAANEPRVWKAWRDELPPLRNDLNEFLAAVEDWLDTHVLPGQMQDILALTNELISLTFRAEAQSTAPGEKKT